MAVKTRAKMLVRREVAGLARAVSRRKPDGPALDVLAITAKVAMWAAILLFALGLILTSCEALGRGLGAGPDPAGNGRAVTVAAARQTASEIQAELYAQGLDAAGYRVERRYGLDGPDALASAFLGSGGAFVFPALSPGPGPDSLELPRARMLDPTRQPVGGAHPAPAVGEEWARASPSAVEALDRATAELDAREFEALVEAVEEGELVVAAVSKWREENGLPDAPGVRPAPVDGEGEKA